MTETALADEEVAEHHVAVALHEEEEDLVAVRQAERKRLLCLTNASQVKFKQFYN